MDSKYGKKTQEGSPNVIRAGMDRLVYVAARVRPLKARELYHEDGVQPCVVVDPQVLFV
jgi:hypothetical protein